MDMMIDCYLVRSVYVSLDACFALWSFLILIASVECRVCFLLIYRRGD